MLTTTNRIKRAIHAAPRSPMLQSIKRVTRYGRAHFCPCCQSNIRHFAPHGIVPRQNARCPVCGALERHRLAWLFLQNETNLFDNRPKRLVHFAPERQLSQLLRRTPRLQYLTADLGSPRADIHTDITRCAIADRSVDAIYASHVLEHVQDDRLAMTELHRVLKPGGWALVQTPLAGDVTYEDPSVTDPQDRLRLFGQHDHVRLYGHDLGDRLHAAGFQVDATRFAERFPPAEASRLGLRADHVLFFCRRPAN